MNFNGLLINGAEQCREGPKATEGKERSSSPRGPSQVFRNGTVNTPSLTGDGSHIFGEWDGIIGTKMVMSLS